MIKADKLLEPTLLWFTGLSGAGKTTIANHLHKMLLQKNIKSSILDGDLLRTGINKDLSFTPKDRKENIRRVAEICKLMLDAGIFILATFIAPYKEDRANVKKVVSNFTMVEIYISTPLDICKKRDVKGLYKKAELGEIKNMTGVTEPYEVPENPDLEIDTTKLSVEEAVNKILVYLETAAHI